MRRGPRPGPLVLLALLAVLLAGVGAALLSNPRYRSVALRGPSGTDVTAPSGISPVASVAPGHLVPLAGADGRIRIPVADRIPSRLPAEGVPGGWRLKEFAGRAAVELVRGNGDVAVRLRSDRASFALYRDVIVDLRQYPILTWRWKVVKLPPAGDVRAAATDDEAAQVYVVFPRWPAPLARSDVIGYVWDSRAPVGLRLRSAKAANVGIVVAESGPARLDVWQRQERNVARDYVALFGRQPPRVGQVALMIDSNDTRTDAEALFGDLAFGRAHAEDIDKPTPMLR